MTFGRPFTIPESYIKLDLPLNDMQMLGPNLEVEPCLSSMELSLQLPCKRTASLLCKS